MRRFPEVEIFKSNAKKANGSFPSIWSPREQGDPNRGATGIRGPSSELFKNLNVAATQCYIGFRYTA